MLSRIQAFRYRCFERLDVQLGAYNVLAGANGSGKSTLLDIPLLLADILSQGLASAFLEVSPATDKVRAQSFQELTYCYQGDYFGFAVEAILPQDIVTYLIERTPASQRRDPNKWHQMLRYEVRFQIVNQVNLHITNEHLWLAPEPATQPERDWEIGGHRPSSWRAVITRETGKSVEMRAEHGRERMSLRLESQQLTLANLPRDTSLFPASVWLIEMLKSGMVHYEPNVLALRTACPPGQPRTIRPDASNLPWLVLSLKQEQPNRFDAWVEHVKTALPNLTSIDAIRREEDYHAYLKLGYRGGYTVTSSGLSDGTLRILALTILPYLTNPPSVVCLEEPENGIHPRAIETVLQSLSSLYNSQVWLSTHSPVVLAHTDLESVIVMRSDGKGGIEAVSGDKHPRLQDWKGGIDLGTLFAAGVLE